MALTKVVPNIIAVANNVTNKTVGNTTSIPSFTFDGAGVVTSASNVAISGAGITANTVANSAFQTGSIENYLRGANLDFGMRNRIINGAMAISQRNGTASANNSNNTYMLDRWVVRQEGTDNKFSIQQDSSANTVAGFTNSMKVTALTTETVAIGDYFAIAQKIEGFNTADLGFGTASARPVTLSFFVRSSLTGTFSGGLINSAANRSYMFAYTISAANTWEQKFVTIAGDTTGTWVGGTNGIGIELFFNLGAGANYSTAAGSWSGLGYRGATGATSVVGQNGATWYVTGVQLEEGSQPTSFEYRQHGTELALCQRYCYAIKASEAVGAYSTFMQQGAYTTTALTGNFIPKVTMRVVPTLSTTGTASNYLVFNGTFYTLNSVPAITTDSTPSSFTVDASVSSGLTAGYVYRMTANNNNVAYLIFSAEL